MLLIVFLLNFLGFYLLYITSSRIVVPALLLRKEVAQRPGWTKIFGVLILSAALLLLIVSYGAAAGIFFFIAMLSFTASVTVLLLPLLELLKR